MSQSEPRREIRSYVLRATRMSKLQRRSYRELLPKYGIPYQDRELDLSSLFPGTVRCIAEIGFGMGEATVRLAAENPDTGYLGIEVHKPGVGKVMSEIDLRGLDNLRVVNHDAVEVFRTMIPQASLDGIHLFFPDPWPKKKHHKRRLLKEDFLKIIIPALKKGGYLYICTDWEEYAREILAACSAVEGISNGYKGFADSQKWRPRTKFEEKGIAQEHPIREILFRRYT